MINRRPSTGNVDRNIESAISTGNQDRGRMTMDTKKVVSVVAIVFVIFFILQNPDDSANIVHSIGHGLSHGFNQLSEFVKKL